MTTSDGRWYKFKFTLTLHLNILTAYSSGSSLLAISIRLRVTPWKLTVLISYHSPNFEFHLYSVILPCCRVFHGYFAENHASSSRLGTFWWLPLWKGANVRLRTEHRLVKTFQWSYISNNRDGPGFAQTETWRKDPQKWPSLYPHKWIVLRIWFTHSCICTARLCSRTWYQLWLREK